MKQFIAILFFFTTSISCNKKSIGSTMPVDSIAVKKYTYLALGDSYTIGERVQASENFPSQVVSSMLNYAIPFFRPALLPKRAGQLMN